MFKRLIFAIIVVTSLLCMAVVPSAGALPSEQYNLHVVKFLLDPSSGESAGAPATGTKMTPPPAGTPVSGSIFIVTKVILPVNQNGIVTSQPSDASQIGNGDGKFPLSSDSADTFEKTTDASGEALFSDLKNGVYYVEEKPQTGVLTSTPFIVKVPMEDPANPGQWLNDVYAYPKAFGLVIAKAMNTPSNINQSSVDGEVVNWLIDTSIPEGIVSYDEDDDSYIQYMVIDVLNPAFVYLPDNNYVYPIETYKEQATPNTPLSSDCYSFVFEAETNTVTMHLTVKGRHYLHDNGIHFIRTVFSTKTDYSKATGNAISNSATVKFIDKFTTITDDVPPTNAPLVFIGKVNIIKVDGKTGTKLNGAKFKIADSYKNARNGTYLKDGNGLDISAVYDETTQSYVFNGINYSASHTGVPDAETQYWIVETEAPKGYKSLKEPVQIDITPKSVVMSDTEIRYLAETTVKNYTGFDLPRTETTGAIIFTVIGVSLIGVAVLFLVIGLTRKSKNKDTANSPE